MHSFILASGSPHRLAILKTLIPDIQAIPPNIIESFDSSEPPETIVKCLATQKANDVIKNHQPAKQSFIIASDQIGVCNQEIIAKAPTNKHAFLQLKKLSNQWVTFYTSLYIYDMATQKQHVTLDTFEVKFRALNDLEIKTYIEREHILNAAGSFKVEGLGITLFESLKGKDFHTLIGLPIIELNQALASIFNYSLLRLQFL